MSQPTLSLLVLRTSHIEDSLAFYQGVGLSLTEEKHGNGPVHYSCQLGETVVEIYPGTPQEILAYRGSGATMPGFRVTSLETTLICLNEIGVQILTPPMMNKWGKRAVIQDPDGRAIELSESPAPDQNAI